MASLTTLVAGLARRVQRAAVRSRAIARDVAELAARVALHSLSLTVPGKVVRATALVACSMASATGGETTPSITAETATASRGGTAAHASGSRVGTRPGEMTRLSAVVAAAASASSTA